MNLPVVLSVLLGVTVRCCIAGTPRPAQYFDTQLVDHDHADVHASSPSYWSQRYYSMDDHFQGPGSPIFLIMGGEGNIEPSTGLYYPFVTHHLARTFGGYVLQAEHRFYGESLPIYDFREQRPDPRIRLLTPKQALQDYMRLLRHTQAMLQCSLDKTSPQYCPVITVGGSYPGWLAAMARLVFPNYVDMAYAASAPMLFYSQQVHQQDYYNHISYVAERIHAGCRNRVQEVLHVANEILLAMPDFETLAEPLGFCPDTIPLYMSKSRDEFIHEIFMMVGYTFANLNMANYPPSNTTGLYRACSIFMDTETDPIEKIRAFFLAFLPTSEWDCVNARSQLPFGPHATISGGDWSGVGDGTSGESWDFQTCTLLVEAIGFSNTSMFPPRAWSLDWMKQHCQARFHVEPQPYKLVKEWGFDDLIKVNATRILFTNGLKDGWSVGGIQQNSSESIIALNFENGAHHSDLSGQGPSDADTDDIKVGFASITSILGVWLDEVQPRSVAIKR